MMTFIAIFTAILLTVALFVDIMKANLGHSTAHVLYSLLHGLALMVIIFYI